METYQLVDPTQDERIIQAKYQGFCCSCFEVIFPGDWIAWDRATHLIRHWRCPRPQVGERTGK